ncbi:Threonine dehydratase biosynthetic, chloroplastic [Capsicum baccatum]|uniref:threonine ammonia-lyase n=1 Tax=Capsicum baccatum TaxID=33114 RepID=A0A2G2VU18_CAPBA|nr:Threonine dehydratase biosynthetic, chloroplastic [Capsicum baccatum]
MKGVIKFGKRGKLSPRYIDLFEILRTIGGVAYDLSLRLDLSAIHPVFHVSMLCHYIPDESHVILWESVQLDEQLSFVEETDSILAREVRRLHSRVILVVKVQWQHRPVDEATWEVEFVMCSSYLQLFVDSVDLLPFPEITIDSLKVSPSPLQPPLTVVSPSSLQCEPGYLIPNYPVGGNGGESGFRYLIDILYTRVYDMAHESPLQGAPKLLNRLGVNVWLKREDLQPWKSVKRLGATVVLVGDVYDEAELYAKKRAEEEGRTFIPPFDHPDVIAGQGTIGMQINSQLKDKIHAIFVPVGGGGLTAGIAACMKRVAPDIKIIGVEPSDANAMAMSLHYGQRVMLDQVGKFADAVAVKVVGEETFRLCKELIDGVVLVSRDAICAAIKDVFEEKRSILEPAGALALAGAEAYCKYYGLKDKNVVAITSGANLNFDRLRLISEFADVGRKREAALAIFMAEELGSFKPSVNSSLRHLICNFAYYMSGRSNIHNELLCRFTFPEKAGALWKFLDAFSAHWNISLIHYRAQGQIGANVFVGIQLPEYAFDEFQGRAERLGYEYVVESINDAFKLIMH